MIDVAVTQNDDGSVLAHAPACPMVQRHRQEGRPIMTMFGCDEPLPTYLEQHQCLKPERK